MDKPDSYFAGSMTALIVVLVILAVFHYKNDSRVLYVPQKPNCDRIVRYEDGSKICEIKINVNDEAKSQIVVET